MDNGADAGAEGAAPFAVSGVEIDPFLFKSGPDHPGQFPVKAGKQLHQQIPGFFNGVGFFNVGVVVHLIKYDVTALVVFIGIIVLGKM